MTSPVVWGIDLLKWYQESTARALVGVVVGSRLPYSGGVARANHKHLHICSGPPANTLEFANGLLASCIYGWDQSIYSRIAQVKRSYSKLKYSMF
jgi:hypothetical protein